MHRFALAAALVIVEHGREALLELQRYTLAHHADAVHRVHEGLRPAREKVSDECFEHGHSVHLSAEK
jgi:hypothetical protein